MRACPACGAANEETDDFCGNCGSYLGWSDAEGAADPEGAGTPDRPADPPARIDSAPGDSDGSSGSGGTDRPGAAVATARPDESREPEVPPTSPEETPSAGTRNGSADDTPAPEPREDTPPPPREPPAPQPQPPVPSQPPVPPQPPAPSPPPRRAAAPQPVKPAKAAAPRPVVRPVSADDPTAGVPCPRCGTPNPPHRRFCRRCAAPLTSVSAPDPLPWWRTVWPLRRRTRAGSGRTVRLLVILGVVLALCVCGFLLLPAGRHLFEDTRDKLGKAKPVTPAQVEATAQVPGHPADDTTDGLSNHYWGAPGPGASVTYTFEKPFRLVDVIITNGASKSATAYARQGRALHMDMEVTAQDGQVHRKQLTLSDKPGFQTFPAGISDVTTIRLTLTSPAGLTRGSHIALAEVEFFRRD
ncbi:zinc ribbon domain-containing protein [Streptomyces sp. NBC_01003]|uniref:NADase-type glycan-binding domain-containing protein n=1 Tax=Streptomyces sp. NBC_01003 TaxID=2903714 RepID=UPI003864687F|nr:zinc ribbon domain-containing protein [Streptomyces sp. NBC_01003]